MPHPKLTVKPVAVCQPVNSQERFAIERISLKIIYLRASPGCPHSPATRGDQKAYARRGNASRSHPRAAPLPSFSREPDVRRKSKNSLTVVDRMASVKRRDLAAGTP